MAKYRPFAQNSLIFFSRKIPFTSCPLSAAHATRALQYDPKDACFSALEMLIRRGLLDSAQKLFQRIIKHSSSAPEVVSAADFAISRGVVLDVKSCAFLIRKLAFCGEVRLAEATYVNLVSSRGIEPDCNLLNSMVVCYSKLGRLEEAKSQFDRLLEMGIVPCPAACSEIICEFCSQNRVLEGFDLFCIVCDAGFLLNFRCYNVLVDGLSSRGHSKEALYVYGFMRARGVPPTLHLLKNLFYMLCQSERVEDAVKVSVHMESFGFFVDKVMYTALINGYCRTRRMNMAMMLFYRMLKVGCCPDNCTYNTLVHGFLSLGMFEKLRLLNQQMEGLGLKLNTEGYQLMITKYCKDLDVDRGLMLLNNMVQCNVAPTLPCYTPLFAALYKENRLAEVDQLYNHFFRHGLLPDEVLFLTVVKNHVGGEINLARIFVAAIASNGCGIDVPGVGNTSIKPVDNILHDINLLLEEIFSRNKGLACIAFNIYLIALCCGGKLDAAMRCMDKMSSLSLQPSLSAYNSMIRCLYQNGQGENAKFIVEVMQDQGLTPNMETFLIAVNEKCKLGDFPSAIGILEQLEESGVKPSVAMYDTIIGHLARVKRISDALKLCDRMCERGIFPDETMFLTMINVLSKGGRGGAARKLFENMLECGVRPGYKAYTALINGLAKNNMIGECCQYLERMLREGFMPNVVLFTSLFNQFLRKGDVGFALQLVDLMERSQIELDLISHTALVNGIYRNLRHSKSKWRVSERNSVKEKKMLYHLLCQYTYSRARKGLEENVSREDLPSLALKLIRKVKETSSLPSLYLCNGIIAGFCWTNNVQAAYCHLGMMLRRGLLPNQVTFTILIDWHFQKGEIDLADNLFHKMDVYGYVPDKVLYYTLRRGFRKAGRSFDAL